MHNQDWEEISMTADEATEKVSDRIRHNMKVGTGRTEIIYRYSKDCYIFPIGLPERDLYGKDRSPVLVVTGNTWREESEVHDKYSPIFWAERVGQPGVIVETYHAFNSRSNESYGK